MMTARYHLVLAATAWMLQQRNWTYSPIVHCHEMARKYSMPTDFAFWGEYNKALICACDELCVLDIPGWRESIGVTAEIKIARDHGKFISMLCHNDSTGYHLTEMD